MYNTECELYVRLSIQYKYSFEYIIYWSITVLCGYLHTYHTPMYIRMYMLTLQSWSRGCCKNCLLFCILSLCVPCQGTLRICFRMGKAGGSRTEQTGCGKLPLFTLLLTAGFGVWSMGQEAQDILSLLLRRRDCHLPDNELHKVHICV